SLLIRRHCPSLLDRQDRYRPALVLERRSFGECNVHGFTAFALPLPAAGLESIDSRAPPGPASSRRLATEPARLSQLKRRILCRRQLSTRPNCAVSPTN